MKMETRSRAIDKIYKRRDRIDMPDFQREEVWPPAKKRLLIDTILQGWHLPKFYFRKLEDGTFECVDGQQRLAAILEFFDDELALDDETARRAGGSKYSELRDDVSDGFDDFEVDIEEIEDATEKELEELFQRLQLGTPLNTAEKLNATGGGLRDYCHEAASHPFFSEKVGLRNTRYAHFQTVAMWAFVEARGIQPQMRFSQLQSLLRDNRSFSNRSELAKSIKSSLHFLDRAFQDKCPYIRNRANTLSICMLAARVVRQGLDGDAEAREFGEFAQGFFKDLSAEVEKGVGAADRELMSYQHAITSGSTGGDSVKTRRNILTKRLAAQSSRFSSLVGAYRDVEEGAVRSISDLSSELRSLLVSANRKHSASAGEDLFKITTDVTESLDVLSRPVRDKAGYAALIDALYFVVYEGSGSCRRLTDAVRGFAVDVKFLRTSLRHDLDHGRQKEISKKLKQSAAVFERFSGKKSPEECGPDDFLTTQLRILTEMRSFLHELV